MQVTAGLSNHGINRPLFFEKAKPYLAKAAAITIVAVGALASYACARALAAVNIGLSISGWSVLTFTLYGYIAPVVMNYYIRQKNSTLFKNAMATNFLWLSGWLLGAALPVFRWMGSNLVTDLLNRQYIGLGLASVIILAIFSRAAPLISNAYNLGYKFLTDNLYNRKLKVLHEYFQEVLPFATDATNQARQLFIIWGQLLKQIGIHLIHFPVRANQERNFHLIDPINHAMSRCDFILSDISKLIALLYHGQLTTDEFMKSMIYYVSGMKEDELEKLLVLVSFYSLKQKYLNFISEEQFFNLLRTKNIKNYLIKRTSFCVSKCIEIKSELKLISDKINFLDNNELNIRAKELSNKLCIIHGILAFYLILPRDILMTHQSSLEDIEELYRELTTMLMQTEGYMLKILDSNSARAKSLEPVYEELYQAVEGHLQEREQGQLPNAQSEVLTARFNQLRQTIGEIYRYDKSIRSSFPPDLITNREALVGPHEVHQRCISTGTSQKPTLSDLIQKMNNLSNHRQLDQADEPFSPCMYLSDPIHDFKGTDYEQMQEMLHLDSLSKMDEIFLAAGLNGAEQINHICHPVAELINQVKLSLINPLTKEMIYEIGKKHHLKDHECCAIDRLREIEERRDSSTSEEIQKLLIERIQKAEKRFLLCQYIEKNCPSTLLAPISNAGQPQVAIGVEQPVAANAPHPMWVKVSRTVFRLFELGSVLVPALVNPVGMGVGVVLGACYYGLVRFGLPKLRAFPKLLANGQERLDQVISWLHPTRVIYLTPTNQAYSDAFGKADFFSKIKIINYQIFSGLLSSIFAPFAITRGFAISRELIMKT